MHPYALSIILGIALFIVTVSRVFDFLRWSRSRKSYEATISTLEGLCDAWRGASEAKDKLIAALKEQEKELIDSQRKAAEAMNLKMASISRLAEARGKLIRQLGWPEPCPTPEPTPSLPPQPPV